LVPGWNIPAIYPLKVHRTSTSAKTPKQTTTTTTLKTTHKCSDALYPGTARFHFGEMVTRPE